MSNAIPLEVKSLTKIYNDFTLDNVSFDIEPGKIVGLIGANGAGKTTTLNLLLNNIQKDSGEALFFGKQISDRLPESVAVVHDDIIYEKGWKISQVAKFAKKFKKGWSQSEFETHVNKFGLAMNKEVGQLSKGMGVKLMIAAAIASNAKLLMLDEPTSGLDPIARDQVCEILLDFVSDKNNSVLFSTHITGDLEKIADSLVFLVKGKLQFQKDKSQLMAEFANTNYKTLDEIIIHLHKKAGVSDD